MTHEEQKVIINSVKGIAQGGMKNLNLNYGQITNTGVEILSEALKMDKSVVKVDLNSNLITEIGMISLGETMKMNSQI